MLLVGGPLLVTVLIALGLGRVLGMPVPAAAYRGAVLAGAGLTILAWPWLGVTGVAWPLGLLLTIAGAFLGGVVSSGLAMGFVEDNAPPQPGMREKVLMHHHLSTLRYPRIPRFKRVFDVVVASLTFIVTLPLWVLIALAIWFEDPGPIFFTKNSVGLGGQTFRQLKFRSMQRDAELTTGPIASYPDDPRKLRCGKYLRRWHLDELPELVNVLNGTMSLVGPRPLRIILVQEYLEALPAFAERHTVKPGIACIAQIKHYQIAPAERLRMDRAYIRRMSVGLDMRLLGRAVLTTLRGARSES